MPTQGRVRPDEARHEQDDEDGRDDQVTDEALLLVDGQPGVVDRQALKRLVRQPRTEPQVESRAMFVDDLVPDLRTAGEVGQLLGRLAAVEPGGDETRERPGGERGHDEQHDQAASGAATHHDEAEHRGGHADDETDRRGAGMGESTTAKPATRRREAVARCATIAEPLRHDHHPGEHRGVVRNLRRRSRPDAVVQPTIEERASRADHQPQQDRPDVTARQRMCQRATSMSRRPHSGVSNHNTATKVANRTSCRRASRSPG